MDAGRHHSGRLAQPGGLPLRWAVIIMIAAVAAVPAASVAGLPGAIATFFMVAGALHSMVG
ncbi:hypothetical protein GCM10027259_60280 [Micromonospora palomenae]